MKTMTDEQHKELSSATMHLCGMWIINTSVDQLTGRVSLYTSSGKVFYLEPKSSPCPHISIDKL